MISTRILASAGILFFGALFGSPDSQGQDSLARTAPYTDCHYLSDEDLAQELSLYAAHIESLKLLYNRKTRQDCSGIFYRLIDEFAKKKCDGYIYPEIDKARSARSIARWFYDQHNLHLVEDPMTDRNLIRPGSVMFYGAPGKKYSRPSIQELCGEGGIFHVGVVTDVTCDEEGNVTQYTLFHGRSTGKIASRTYYHSAVGPPRAGRPLLGAGSEAWVATGYLFTPVKQ